MALEDGPPVACESVPADFPPATGADLCWPPSVVGRLAVCWWGWTSFGRGHGSELVGFERSFTVVNGWGAWKKPLVLEIRLFNRLQKNSEKVVASDTLNKP